MIPGRSASLSRRGLQTAILAAAAAAAAISMTRTLAHLASVQTDEVRTLDFTRYYATAVIGTRFGWDRLYDPDAQEAVADSLGIPLFLPNVYTPALSLFVLPFTALQPRAAFLLWSAVSLACIVAAWMLLAPGSPALRALLLTSLFAPYAVQLGILHGQVLPIQLVFVAAAVRLLESRNDAAAGLALLALFLKPQGMQLVPLALLCANHRRAFVAFLIGAAVIGAAVFGVIGIAGAEAYLRRLAWAQQHPFEMMVAWDYTLARRFETPWLRAAVLGAVTLLTLFAAWKHRQSPEVVCSTAIVGSLLGSPYLHLYDFIWLFPAGWLLLRASPTLVAGGAMALLFAFVLWSAPPSHAARWVLAGECLWLLAIATLPRRCFPPRLSGGSGGREPLTQQAR